MTPTRTKPDADLAWALTTSIDCLRMAEKILNDTGYEKTAYYLRLQAEKNQRILCETGGLL
jgi:hypothetical protein